VSSSLIEQLCSEAVELKKIPMAGMLERLAGFAIESAQSKGCPIQFEYEGQGVVIDKKLIGKAWDPLSKIVRWMIENSFENPEDRVKAGKLPMGFLRVQTQAKGNLIHIVLEDDGLGQGDGDATPQGLLLRNFVDSVRSQLRSISATITLESHLGRSTRIEIAFPSSRWMLDLIHVMCTQKQYMLPHHMVRTLIDPGSFSTHVLRGEKQLVEYNGKLYPFVTLTELIEKTQLTKRRVEQSVAIEKGYVALIRYGRDTVAVGLDAVYESSTRIVHPLQRHLANVRGLQGTVIDANGDPIFAVDLLEVIESFLRVGAEREVA
jgi:chemotaxis protein histidine kinase CheA